MIGKRQIFSDLKTFNRKKLQPTETVVKHVSITHDGIDVLSGRYITAKKVKIREEKNVQSPIITFVSKGMYFCQ